MNFLDETGAIPPVPSLVALFALAPVEQIQALPALPRDRGAADFHTAFDRNPLWLATRALVALVRHDDHVPYETWRESVGLPGGWETSPLPELTCVLEMLGGHVGDGQNLFSAKALGSKTEWRLARRLARLTLQELTWSDRIDSESLATALAAEHRIQLGLE